MYFDRLYIMAAAPTGNGDLDRATGDILPKIGMWGSAIAGIIGVIMVVVAIYYMSKRLMSRNGGSVRLSWVMLAIMFVIGAIFAVSGINNFMPIMFQGLNGSVQNLGAESGYDGLGFDSNSNLVIYENSIDDTDSSAYDSFIMP